MQNFIKICQEAQQNSQLLKITLSNPSTNLQLPLAFPENTAIDIPLSGCNNIYFRPILLKAGFHLQAVYRFKTKDITKNYPISSGWLLLTHLLTHHVFNTARLFSTQADTEINSQKKGQWQLKTFAATQIKPTHTAHNRTKNYLLPTDQIWWYLLGITNTNGEVLKNMQAKHRQIQRYIEIIHHLLQNNPLLSKQLHIVDMGAGKGYLTFALYHYLIQQQQSNLQPQITGIELKEELVTQANKIAQQCQFEGLHFISGAIKNYQPNTNHIKQQEEQPNPDLLIALHACDTATDDAIALGIKLQTPVIICAPCCHKHLRQHLQPTPLLQPLLRQGILLERQAELLTDGLRALILEAHGYKTRVFEFVATEHTPKNVLLVAEKQTSNQNTNADEANNNKNSNEVWQKIAALKTNFGITQLYLEQCLR